MTETRRGETPLNRPALATSVATSVVTIDSLGVGRAIPPASLEAQPGHRVHLGRFELLERLGAGGMGTVYAAYDPQLERNVALKLLHDDGARGSPARRRRLQQRLLREARALARLDDPHVVSVFEVGSVVEVDGAQDEGGAAAVFVAMEHVPGRHLMHWLREAPRSVGSIRRVLRDAGHGLAAAHDAGVVHRDVKPSNIMVRDDGAVRVLDFGLAQSLDEATATTPCGDPCGTLPYMSPEQAAGVPVGPASDLFSFCVTYYLALFGTLPHACTERDPARPDDWRLKPPPHRAGVPRRVVEVLARGLAHDPARRPASMRELLTTLEPLSPRGRRRRLAGLAVLAMLAVGSAVGSVRGTASLLPETRSETPCGAGAALIDEAWDGAGRGERARRLQAAFWRLETPWAREVAAVTAASLDSYRARWLEHYTRACEATRQHRMQSSALLDRRLGCLERRRRELGALVDVLSHDPASALPHAAEAAASLPAIDRCSDLESLLATASSQPGIAPPHSPSSTDSEARANDRPDGDRPDGDRLGGGGIDADLARARAHLLAGAWSDGLGHADSALERAEQAGDWSRAADAHLLRGLLHEANADAEAASDAYDAALRDAGAAGHRRVTAEALVRLVRVAALLQADLDSADRHAAIAATALDRLHHADPALAADLADHRGLSLRRRGHARDAASAHRKALALRTDGSPIERAKTLVRLGSALKDAGDFGDAERYLEQAADLAAGSLGSGHPTIAATLDRLGALALDVGDYPRARMHLERALSILRRALDDTDPRIADTLLHLGSAHVALGEIEAAQAAFGDAEALYRRTVGPSHPHLAAALNNRGTAFMEHERPDLALEPFGRALAMHRALHGTEHVLVAFSEFNLGEAHNDLGRFTVALDLHHRARRSWQRQLSTEHYLLAHSGLGLGRALLGIGRLDAAEETLRDALDRWQDAGRDPAYEAETRLHLARLLDRRGRAEEAEREIATARRRLDESAGRHPRLQRQLADWRAL
ncbi:MAG: serine/threonine-protein kinase [Acidobacteriota bacterium]